MISINVRISGKVYEPLATEGAVVGTEVQVQMHSSGVAALFFGKNGGYVEFDMADLIVLGDIAKATAEP